MMALQVILTVLMLVLVVVSLAWPLLHGVDEREIDAERRELEDAKESKYREIKDAELEFKAGRLTQEQWSSTDDELRREAMLILRKIDTLGAAHAAEKRPGAEEIV